MDSSLFKDINIGGLRYHYYCHPAKSTNNPTLLFLHGFPSIAEHWEKQVLYFTSKGYGVIALDMLGFGGTSKALDTKLYDGAIAAGHSISILDAEGVDKVIVISHDWGCAVGSRLANLYPDRHLASIFISVPYIAPTPEGNIDARINLAKEKLGLDLYSYWKFFASEEGPRIIAEHEDSFFSLVFTSDPAFWRRHFSPEGEMKKWLLADSQAPLAVWAPDKEKYLQYFKADGWYAPTNYYRSAVQGVLNESDKGIPKDRYMITHPVLQVTTLHDAVCLPMVAEHAIRASCTQATIRSLDTGHWPMFERPDELNAVIDEFITSLRS